MTSVLTRFSLGLLFLQVAEIKAEPPRIPLSEDKLFSTQTLFDLGRLDKSQHCCGVDALSDEALDSLTSEVELKAIRWFVILGALTEEHEELRKAVEILLGRQGGIVDRLADSVASVDGVDSLIISGLATEAIGLILLAQSSGTSTAEEKAGARNIGTFSVSGALPFLSAWPGVGTWSAARIRYAGNNDEITLQQQESLANQFEYSGIGKIGKHLGTLFKWNDEEYSRFARAVKVRVLNSLHQEIRQEDPRVYSGYQDTEYTRAGEEFFSSGLERKRVITLKPLKFSDFLDIAKNEGLISENEARWLNRFSRLQEKLGTIDSKQTKTAVEQKMTRVDGGIKLTPKAAFEQNVVTANAYHRLLKKLRQELSQESLHSPVIKEIDRLIAEVSSSVSTIKIMCDLGHLDHLRLFSGEGAKK